MMGVHSNFNLKDYDELNKYKNNLDVRYSYGDAKNISLCELKNGYIVGLQNGDPKFSNESYTKVGELKDKDLELCVHKGILYAFDEENSLNSAKDSLEYAQMLSSLWESNKALFETNATDNSCPQTAQQTIPKLEAIQGISHHAVDLKNCSSRMLAKKLALVRMNYERDQKKGMTLSNIVSKTNGLS
ncbi:MAG: hypothetical protein GXP45_03265 [bacterium]|nr:hypothetical protein [bacterium]